MWGCGCCCWSLEIWIFLGSSQLGGKESERKYTTDANKAGKEKAGDVFEWPRFFKRNGPPQTNISSLWQYDSSAPGSHLNPQCMCAWWILPHFLCPHSSFYPIHYSHTELPVDLGFSRSLLFSVCDIIAVHILFKHANSVITHHHKMYNLAIQKWAFKGTVHPKTDLYDFLNWNAKDVSLNVNTKLLRTIKKYSNQRHVSTIKMPNMINLLYSKSSALIW